MGGRKCEVTDDVDKMTTSKVNDVDMEVNPQNMNMDNINHPPDGGTIFIPYSASESEEVKESTCDETEEEDDDEVEVVKANIFKYQGKLSQDQEISQGILHFEYYDDFNDDDDPNTDQDMSLVEEEEVENTTVCCDQCGGLFENKDLEIHKETDHPPKKKNFMQFTGGNFFMLA